MASRRNEKKIMSAKAESLPDDIASGDLEVNIYETAKLKASSRSNPKPLMILSNLKSRRLSSRTIEIPLLLETNLGESMFIKETAL